MNLVIFLVLQVKFRFMGCLVKANAPVSVCIYTVRFRCFDNICTSLKKDYIVYLEIFGEII